MGIGDIAIFFWSSLLFQGWKRCRQLDRMASCSEQCFLWWNLMHRRLAPKERYPNLFLIVRDKDAKVVNYLAYKNGCIYWNLLFIREVHGESDSSFSKLCGGLGIGSLVFSLFGVSSVLSYSVLQLSCWKGWFGKRSNGEIWKAVPSCLIKCITIYIKNT